MKDGRQDCDVSQRSSIVHRGGSEGVRFAVEKQIRRSDLSYLSIETNDCEAVTKLMC